MASYLGQEPGQGQAEYFIFTASGTETSVSTADDGLPISYTVNQVSVYLNGVKLIVGTGKDCQATDGSTITGLAALAASDVVEVVALSSFSAADSIPSTGGTYTGQVTLPSPVINTAVSGSAVLDEDAMGSNSATKLATQQSIKAYADTKAPIAGPTFTGTVAIPNVANLETAVVANTAKVTNATHSGDVTGATALTIADDAVTGGKLANDIAISTTGNIATTSSGTITSAGIVTAPSLVLTPGSAPAETEGAMYYDSTTNVVNVYNGSAWEQINNPSTGGMVTTHGSYTVHTFLTSGVMTFTSVHTDVAYLIVAGGGGGCTNNWTGSGGGGGEALMAINLTVSASSYPILVGAGGNGAHLIVNEMGLLGGDSSFAGYTARGGNPNPSDGNNAYSGNGNSGGTGSGSSGNYAGAGGGGAGAASTNTVGGAGAVNDYQTGSGQYYGGGGGGGFVGAIGSQAGGTGGGGASTVNGTPNTGGGGGGGSVQASYTFGGSGGSGIVVIRYGT